MRNSLITILFLLGSLSFSFGQNLCLVWPGDANDNGIVNNHDLLYVGLAYGYSGPQNNYSGNVDWNSVVSNTWGNMLPNSIDYVHVDCNGDGAVDFNDTTAIVSNYMNTHDFPNPENPANGVTNFDAPLALINLVDSSEQGTLVEFDIQLGDINLPIQEFHGIAFSIMYDPTLVQPSTMKATYDDTWIGSLTTMPNLFIDVDDSNYGRLDIALTITEQYNVSGFGSIGTVGFVLEENLIAKDLLASIDMQLDIVDVHAIDNNLNTIPIAGQRSFLTIYGEETTELQKINPSESKITAYPNPADNILNLTIKDAYMETLRVYDATGKLVLNETNEENHLSKIDVSTFNSGIYFFEIITSDGIEVKKITIK